MPDGPDIADLQAVMRAIDDRLPDIAAAIPRRLRPLVPNALLNLSVEQLLEGESAEATAGILRRLAALISGGERPKGGDGFRLDRYDA